MMYSSSTRSTPAVSLFMMMIALSLLTEYKSVLFAEGFVASVATSAPRSTNLSPSFRMPPTTHVHPNPTPSNKRVAAAAATTTTLHVSSLNTEENYKNDTAVAAVPTTMKEAIITFFAGKYNGPRTIVLAIASLIGWRCSLLSSASFSLTELVVAMTTIVFWCFQEHVLHQHVLHSRLPWYGQHIHERHHQNPYVQISIDPCLLMVGWMTTVGLVLAWLLPTLALSLTATLFYASAGLFYEWAHYIVHTRVKFRPHTFWDAVKQHHVRHHTVDHNYWFAFSWIGIDDIMGTNPSVKEIMRQKQQQRSS